MFKNHTLMIAGAGRLDNRDYYGNDGVHFNDEGLDFYVQTIKKLVDYLITRERKITDCN